MKQAKRHRSYSSRWNHRYAYPNAADSSYFYGKLLDGITALVTGMGTITLLFYIMTM